MKEIIIDPKFRETIPALSEEEYRQLEENIRRDGCLDPLRLWRGSILVDGHHRYEICQKLNKPFKTVELKDLEDEDDVQIWIYNHQLGKRNVNPQMFAYMIGEVAKLLARKGKRGKRGAAKKNQQNVDFSRPATLTAIGKEHGLSDMSVGRHVQYADALNDIEKKGGDIGKRAKRAILNGKMRMTREAIKEIAKQDANTIQVVMEARLAGESDKSEQEVEEVKAEIADAQDPAKVDTNRKRRSLAKSQSLKKLDNIDKLSKSFHSFSRFVLKLRNTESAEEVLANWDRREAVWLYSETDKIIEEMQSWRSALAKRFPELRRKLKSVG